MSVIPKVMIIIALIISALLYWATTNVCRYNFALEKRTAEINIVSAEVQPTLGLAKVYYYEELKIHTETENIIIPIHGFPVLDR